MSEARSAAQLAASIPVRVGETLPTARALEDAAVAAHAPPLVSRLRAIDLRYDRAMAALRARYQQRESRYDEEWPDPPRDIWGLDAIALVIVAVGVAVVPASVQFSDRINAPFAAALCAGALLVATLLHGVNALRSRGGGSVSNQRASSVVGFDAVAALVGSGLIVWGALVPRDGAPLDSVLVSAGIAATCGIVLILVWIDARRRGAPERGRVKRYVAAEASWREDLDVEAGELAARSRNEALAAALELADDARAGLEGDLIEAARILRGRDDVPYEIATVFAEAPFGALRYDDRV